MMKIRERQRFRANAPSGQRAGAWTEWQVWDGNRIVFRGELRQQAERYIREHEDGERTE